MRASPAISVAVLLVMAAPLRAAEIPQEQRRSGFSFMASETQAMQHDDTTNPGMLWVLDGEKLWNTKIGAASKACADCHNDPRVSMKGVAARYPAFDKRLGRPVDLEQRINLCRAEQQQATPLAYESHDLLALTKRGEAIIEGELHPFMIHLQYFKDLLALPRLRHAKAAA